MPPVLKVRGFEAFMDLFRGTRPQSTNPREISLDVKYSDAIDDNDWYRFSALNGDLEDIDGGLEALLALHYSVGIKDIRPVGATNILPDDRNSDLMLASKTLYAMAESKFFRPEDTDAVDRYETMIKFIQDQHGLTRAEIDAYYREALHVEISSLVATEFNKVSFLLSNSTAFPGYKRSGDSVLARNPQTGHYTLTYTAYQAEPRQISAPTLDALLAEMSKLPEVFDQTGINNLKTEAEKIPALIYSELKNQGYADAQNLITDALVNFYIAPSQDTYKVLLGIQSRLNNNVNHDEKIDSYWGALKSLSDDLYLKIARDPTQNTRAAYTYLTDRKYEVFSAGGIVLHPSDFRN